MRCRGAGREGERERVREREREEERERERDRERKRWRERDTNNHSFIIFIFPNLPILILKTLMIFELISLRFICHFPFFVSFFFQLKFFINVLEDIRKIRKIGRIDHCT